jgi:hypothetical protein
MAAADTSTVMSFDVSQPDHVTLNVVATGQQQPKVAEVNVTESVGQGQGQTVSVFQRQPDDFYNTIFYFSGMGHVIGSALAEGIYVDEKTRRNAIDSELIESATTTNRKSGDGGSRDPEQLVVTARGQAQNLSSDFHKLHGLLDSLPIFTGGTSVQQSRDASRRNEPDQPIHGELYFRCKERFPVQPTTTSGSRSPSQRSSVHDVSVGLGGGAVESRRRQQYDDGVLADVARAAVDAFPLLPAPAGTHRTSSRQHSPSVPTMSPDPLSSRRRRTTEDEITTTASYSIVGY